MASNRGRGAQVGAYPGVEIVACPDALVRGNAIPSGPEVVKEWVRETNCLLFVLFPAVVVPSDVVSLVASQETALDSLDVVLPEHFADFTACSEKEAQHQRCDGPENLHVHRFPRATAKDFGRSFTDMHEFEFLTPRVSGPRASAISSFLTFVSIISNNKIPGLDTVRLSRRRSKSSLP